MAKLKNAKTTEPKLKVPFLISKNHSITPLRMQKEKKQDEKRYPLGRYPFPIAIIHGSRTSNALERVRQAEQGGGIVLNHPDNIRNASDKLTTKRLLVEAGVPTTPFMAAIDVLRNDKWAATRMTLNYPVVAKLRTGMGGTGMSLLENIAALRTWKKSVKTSDLSKYFFEEVFNWQEGWTVQDHNKYTREYRMGVSPLLNGRSLSYIFPIMSDEGVQTSHQRVELRNGCIVSLRKMMRSEASRNGAFGRNLALGNSYFVREFKKDYTYTKRSVVMEWEEGVQYAQMACETLGLDYGAVDILWSSQTGEWCVVEVNTAPAMGSPEDGQSYTLEQWRQAFRYMIQVKREQQGLA